MTRLDTTQIIVAALPVLGSALGVFMGVLLNTRLTAYRLEQLEKKVDKHNNAVERTMILEEQMKVANHRLTDLEHFTAEVRA